MIRRLLPAFSKYILFILLAPFFIIIEVLLEIRIPIIMANIINKGISSGDIRYVTGKGGLMIMMAVLALICGVLSSKFASQASIGFGSELRKQLFDKIQELSFSNMDKYNTSSLVTRLTTDITNIQNAFMMSIRLLVRSPIMMVGATVMAMSFNRNLTNIFLSAIPILAAALVIITATAFPKFQAMLVKYDGLNASVQENLIAARVVKAFVRSDYEKKKFGDATEALKVASIRAEKIIIYAIPLMQLTMYGCIVAILWFGGQKIIINEMEIGDLMGFISYVSQILMSLMMIAMVFVNLVMSRASLRRVVDILEEEVDIKDGENRDLVVENGSISLSGVCFQYQKDSKNHVLEHINIDIQSGETIGIIGGTGSAKTTLVQLIPRLYDVTEGEVIVGGHNVKDYTLHNLREAVSMVLQNNVLFSGTIKENLKWGDEHATDEQVVEACQAACADDFIMTLPNGYETELGQGGVNLSGGQKQRICIARALLKKPKIIILDDSTSAVDTATDARIREGFELNLKETTTIIIAQRISSICHSDKIIVMDEGEVHGMGTHEELMASNTIYQEVYNSQQKGVA